MEFTSKTNSLLKASGWYTGRQIDITHIENSLINAGFEVFPSVQSFLREFGDLTVIYPYDDNEETGRLQFGGVEIAIAYLDKMSAYSVLAQDKLCVIGSNNDDIVMMDPKGEIYYAWNNGFSPAPAYPPDKSPIYRSIETFLSGSDRKRKIAVQERQPYQSFSKETDALLIEAGWYKGRKIDIHEIEAWLTEEGYPIIPAVRDFLQEFGNLYIFYPALPSGAHKSRLHFDPVEAGESYAPFVTGVCSKIVGESVCVIGEDNQDMLMMGESGKVYGYWYDIGPFAASGIDAIELILRTKQ